MASSQAALLDSEFCTSPQTLLAVCNESLLEKCRKTTGPCLAKEYTMVTGLKSRSSSLPEL